MTFETVDETFIGVPIGDTNPPDMFSFDSVLRKGLGALAGWERKDMQRQCWLSWDDEHRREVWGRRHEVPRTMDWATEFRASDFFQDE